MPHIRSSLRRVCGFASALLLALVLSCAPAHAGRDPTLPLAGVGDNAPGLFADPAFRARAVPVVRLIVAWDAVYRDPARLEAWLGGARSSGSHPLVAFANATGCPGGCTPPSRAQLGAAFDVFRSAFPWVMEFTAWNEANLAAGTATSPTRAAGYQDELTIRCPWCTIVAADVLDSPGMGAWLSTYQRALQTTPTTWGLHNYYDGRNLTDVGLRTMLDRTQGEVWLTETGGIVRADPATFGEEAAAAALAHVWNGAADHRSRVRRVYAYSWFAGAPQARFDAGLLDLELRPRPALGAFDRMLAGAPHIDVSTSSGAAGPTRPGADDAPPGARPQEGPASARQTVSTGRLEAGGLRLTGLRWVSRRAVRVTLSCERRGRCRASVVLRGSVRRARRTLARCAVTLAAGATARATLRLRRAHITRLRVTLTASRPGDRAC